MEGEAGIFKIKLSEDGDHSCRKRKRKRKRAWAFASLLFIFTFLESNSIILVGLWDQPRGKTHLSYITRTKGTSFVRSSKIFMKGTKRQTGNNNNKCLKPTRIVVPFPSPVILHSESYALRKLAKGANYTDRDSPTN